MNGASTTYQEDVLARYGQTSAVKITQSQHRGWIQVTLENGKRLSFFPKLQLREMGIEPRLDVSCSK